jgi:tetratricopeptide (TPR) repeat protein
VSLGYDQEVGIQPILTSPSRCGRTSGSSRREGNPIADRFIHIATIGIIVAFAPLAVEWAGKHPRWRKPAMWVVCALLAVLAGLVEDSDYMRGNLAKVLVEKGDYDRAESQLRAAIHLASGNHEYRNNLASLPLRTGRPDQVATETAIAIRLGPNNTEIADTALTLIREENYAGALAQFNHAAQLGGEPQPIAAKLNDAGASLASRGRPREAEPLIRRAAELNPTLVQARRNLVLVLEDQGRLDEARGALQQAIEITGPRREHSDLIRELTVPGTPAVEKSR